MVKQCHLKPFGRLGMQQTENVRVVRAGWAVVFQKSLIDQARNSCGDFRKCYVAKMAWRLRWRKMAFCKSNC